MPPENLAPQHNTLVLPVYPAELMRVCDGVNLGDTVAAPGLACTGDTYRLPHDAQALSLTLTTDTLAKIYGLNLRVTSESEIDTPQARAQITARLTFMTAIGTLVEALTLTCGDGQPRSYIHPLGALAPGTDYTLIASDLTPKALPLAGFTAMSFGQGTRVTLSDGSQCPVEDLNVGDRVLTRDSGMKPILWLGRRNVQAVGTFAPVIIGPGVMGNAENVTLAQNHRVLISDWRAEVMVGTRDVLIRAKDLVNGGSIFVRSGGFVEYTQIVFDQHEVIYAEGIPTESLLMTEEILSSLPDDLAKDIRSVVPRPGDVGMMRPRVPLDGPVATSLLRETGRF